MNKVYSFGTIIYPFKINNMIIITELSKIKEDLFKIKWEYGIDTDILNSLKETDPRIYNMFYGVEMGTTLTYDRYNGKILTIINNENDVLTIKSDEPLNYPLQVGMTLIKTNNTIRGEYDPTNCHEPINN